MKITKEAETIHLPFMMLFLGMLLFLLLPSGAQAKTVKAVRAGQMYQVGNKVYYTHPQYGSIYVYNTKTKKKTKLRGNEGHVYGYASLIVKGKYIYALLDKSLGSDGLYVDAEIDRISLNGKTKKKLADHVWGEFFIAGSKILYAKRNGGNGEYASKGAAMYMKLNGKSKKSAAAYTVQTDPKSLAYVHPYGDTLTAKTGKYKYTIDYKGKYLKRGSKKIYTVKGYDFMPYIGNAQAHGTAVLVTYNFYKKVNGYDMSYAKLIYMDKNGKHKKTLSTYVPVG